MNDRLVAGFAALAFSLGVTSSYAQQKQQFAAAQKQNREALQHYTWKSRTEIKMKGESKSVQLEQVRYDLNAKLQKTPIEGAPQQEAADAGGKRGGRRGGRLKQKIIENKKEEFAALLKSLGQLVAGYAHLPPDEMQAFAEGAAVGPGEGETLLIKGVNVLQPGDTMSVWIDPSSYMMKRVEIHTAFEEKPVHFVTEFRGVAEGPTYPARSVLEYPDKEVELIVDNYDYQRLGG
jgi:hypothetical protein